MVRAGGGRWLWAGGVGGGVGGGGRGRVVLVEVPTGGPTAAGRMNERMDRSLQQLHGAVVEGADVGHGAGTGPPLLYPPSVATTPSLNGGK